MTDMIERVAQAIYDQQSDGAGPVSDFYPVARAAIEAMREPTDKMVQAAEDGMVYTQDLTFGQISRFAWRDMIDDALADPEKYEE